MELPPIEPETIPDDFELPYDEDEDDIELPVDEQETKPDDEDDCPDCMKFAVVDDCKLNISFKVD